MGECQQFDYSTAEVDYATGGGGTRKQSTPVQAIQARNRPNCSVECSPEQSDGAASNCEGSAGSWAAAGNKHFCDMSG